MVFPACLVMIAFCDKIFCAFCMPYFLKEEAILNYFQMFRFSLLQHANFQNLTKLTIRSKPFNTGFISRVLPFGKRSKSHNL